MRILVTACPTYGHFFPLVPLCWALRSSGHEVLAAMPGKFSSIASSAGVMSVRVSDVDHFYGHKDQAVKHEAPKWGSNESGTHKSRVVESVINHVIDTYVPISYSISQSMVSLAEKWKPDLILHTPWEYSGPLAATVLGIPRVSHSWGVALPEELAHAETEALKPLLSEWRVAGIKDAACHIDICPPSLQYEKVPAITRNMRYISFNGSTPVEPWLLEPAKKTRVCVSIGSVPIENGHSNLLENIISALARMDVEAFVLTGGVKVPLKTIPANVHLIGENIPLNHILPTCDFVIHHGGSGSTMTSSTLGLPQLAIPQMCDQFRHSERVAESMVGIAITTINADPNDIYHSAMELMRDGKYRDNAKKIQAENQRQTHPGEMVPFLRKLVDQ